MNNFFYKTETYKDSWGNEETERTLRTGRVTFIGFILVLALVWCILSIHIIPTGHTGVISTFGKVDGAIDSGFNFILPWQKVVKMDNRSQKVEIETEAFSSDIQQVQIVASFNYSIDKEASVEIYKTVGKKYYDNIIYPRILENIKAVFAEYTAENLIANRNTLSNEVTEVMKADMTKYGITVISVSIEDIDFTEAFTNAVEAKQVAAQEKLTAETKQEQLTMEQKAKAERDVIAANAELEVTKIQAESAFYAGEKEAEMNKKIAESITPELVRYYYIKQWNGELPKTVLGEDNAFMLNLEN